MSVPQVNWNTQLQFITRANTINILHNQNNFNRNSHGWLGKKFHILLHWTNKTHIYFSQAFVAITTSSGEIQNLICKDPN